MILGSKKGWDACGTEILILEELLSFLFMNSTNLSMYNYREYTGIV